MPTGGRRTGGASWQGGAPGAQCHGPEGGEAWPEAEAPTSECPVPHIPPTHTHDLDSSDVHPARTWDVKPRAHSHSPFFESHSHPHSSLLSTLRTRGPPRPGSLAGGCWSWDFNRPLTPSLPLEEQQQRLLDSPDWTEPLAWLMGPSLRPTHPPGLRLQQEDCK